MLNKIREHKGYFFIGLILFWFALSKVFAFKNTLELQVADNTKFTTAVGDLANSISGNRTKSPAFVYFFNPIRLFINKIGRAHV